MQWWYWTGHLATADGRRFGVEACFFVFTDETLLPQRRARRPAAAPLVVAEAARLAPRSPRLPDGALRADRRERTTATSTARCSSSALPAVQSGTVRPGARLPARPSRHGQTAAAATTTCTLPLPPWSLDLTMTSDDATVPPALHYGGLAPRLRVRRLHVLLLAAAHGRHRHADARRHDRSRSRERCGSIGSMATSTPWSTAAGSGSRSSMNDGRSIMLFDILDLPARRTAR